MFKIYFKKVKYLNKQIYIDIGRYLQALFHIILYYNIWFFELNNKIQSVS